jgi:hypothetical protein
MERECTESRKSVLTSVGRLVMSSGILFCGERKKRKKGWMKGAYL